MQCSHLYSTAVRKRLLSTNEITIVTINKISFYGFINKLLFSVYTKTKTTKVYIKCTSPLKFLFPYIISNMLF